MRWETLNFLIFFFLEKKSFEASEMIYAQKTVKPKIGPTLLQKVHFFFFKPKLNPDFVSVFISFDKNIKIIVSFYFF